MPAPKKKMVLDRGGMKILWAALNAIRNDNQDPWDSLSDDLLEQADEILDELDVEFDADEDDDDDVEKVED